MWRSLVAFEIGDKFAQRISRLLGYCSSRNTDSLRQTRLLEFVCIPPKKRDDLRGLEPFGRFSSFLRSRRPHGRFFHLFRCRQDFLSAIRQAVHLALRRTLLVAL